MTKSYPYNIIVTRNPLVVDKLFFDKLGRSSFTDVFSRLNEDEKKESLIVSPRSNNNFISLDVNFPPKVAGDETKYVILKLLETSKLLEYFSVTPTSFETQLMNRAKVLKGLRGAERVLSDIGESQSITPKYYLSFGMGDDMREWSGPYSLDLVDANISITSDGVRELELMFTPVMESLKVFTNKLFHDYQYAQSDSIFDTVANEEPIIKTERPYKLANNGQANKPDDGWNYCVRDIVGSYISERFESVPRGNVLVLLPDDFMAIVNKPINTSDTIDSIYKRKLKTLGIDITLDSREPVEEGAKPRSNDKILEAIVSAQSAKLKKLRSERDQLTGKIVRAELIEEIEGPGLVKELTKQQDEVKRKIKELEKQISFTKNKPQGAEYKATGRTLAGEYNSNPDDIQIPRFNASEYKNFILGMGGIIQVNAEDLDNTLLVLKPLYNFIKGVNDSSERPRDFTILEENDAKILKLLKKYELIESAESPVILFGRFSTIKELMYPTETGKVTGITAALGISPNILAMAGATGMGGYTGTPVFNPRNNPIISFDNLPSSWRNYINDFVKTFKSKGIRTSSFGEGLGDYEKAIMQMAKKTGSDLLIFTHNIKNSNVLSLSFDSSPYKEVLMNYSMESSYKIAGGVLTKKELLADNSFGTSELQKLVTEAAKQLAINPDQDITAFLKTFFSSKEGSWNLKQLSDVGSDVTVTNFIYAVLIKARGASNISLKGPAGRNSIGEADILMKMNKSIIEVSIKTLPFFNTTVIPGSKCVLFGKPNLIKGATELRGKIEEVPAFFTNAYQIVGYKHRITSTDAFSEFKLIQDGFAQGVEFRNMKLLDFFNEEVKRAVKTVLTDEEARKLAARKQDAQWDYIGQ